VCLTLLAPVIHAQEQSQSSASSGQWLLNYGRAHGLAITDPQPDDAKFILIWIDAALQLSPNLSEAHRWRSDLLFRLNKKEEAIHCLAAYCKREPQDIPALMALLEVQLADKQKLEDRVALCQSFLKRPNLTIDAQGNIHLRLATMFKNRGDDDEAMRHAQMTLDSPSNRFAAQLLLAQLQNDADEEYPPRIQVDFMLKEVALDPISPQPAWRLADYLKQIGLYDHAITWLQIASDTQSQSATGQTASPQLLTEIAEVQLLRGEFTKAIAQSQQVLTVASRFTPASFVIIQAAQKLGRTELANDEINKLTARFREVEAHPNTASAQTCLDIARFHLDIQPDPQRAVRYATLAAEKEPRNPSIKQRLGQAYEAAGLHREAADILKSAKPLDNKSAVALAKAQQALGDSDGAIQTLKQVAARFLAEDRGELNQSLQSLGQPVPAENDFSAAEQLLSQFDRFPLEFAKKPLNFIDFDATLDKTTHELGTSLTATITLTNYSNHPIILGVNRMLNPQINVSLVADSRMGLHLNNYLTIELMGDAVLQPGESRSITRSLTTAAGRIFLNAQPQHRIDLNARFILDPVFGANGAIVSRFQSIAPLMVKFMRLPVDATPDGLSRIRDNLRASDEAARVRALETVVVLILERLDSMLRKPHTYHALSIDAEKLTADALTMLRDPSPHIRARTLSALTRLPLSQPTIQAAAPLISDSHWLVRLLAVEFFAKKQGLLFLPVLERLAEDPHPIVARLATLYRDQARELKRTTHK